MADTRLVHNLITPGTPFWTSKERGNGWEWEYDGGTVEEGMAVI